MHDTRPDSSGIRRAFFASLTGTALEWYDFAVYSAAAALVFGDLFFPSEDPLTGTLLAFSTYAVGYVSRPLGGIVFGRLGDVIGRKKVLIATLVLIGFATFLIGVLPAYSTIGVAAPVALVLLRFAQGVGVGGEWGGAVLLSSEFGDPKRRGFYASAAQIGPPAGNLLANGVLAALGALLSEDQFTTWGWRVAFLVSAALVGFGLWIRARLEETPVFKAMEAEQDRPQAPVREVFTTQPRALAAAILSRIAPDVLYAMFTVFVLTYATDELDMSRGSALAAVLIGSALQIGLIPLAGALTDRVNRRLVYGVSAIGAGVWPFVFFPMVGGGSWPLLALGVVVALVLHSLMYGPQAAFIAEQFSPRLRYTGSSLAYTLAGVIGGAVAPLLFTALLGAYGSWVPLALYIALTAVVTVVGLALGRDADRAETEDALLVEQAREHTDHAPAAQ
ncbi:MFS transporter [Streptomyces griseoviridis]|uniref:MFS family permease n=3 Tax=Streptomyces TaxID=1883 RepID=A0ABT9LMV9_STRGD|nr:MULTISPECIES: MFS transporter [Streptomyces]MDP9684864.1 MFS family permease [Streptomyces griseoviridis]GGS52722.1 MFS transporter [Streptomyces niveoruber]GGT19812.1 MFS transporter [Streptomyces griseoviridis]GGU46850.1 MFS transporter [Streptomyces daghestanicus]GHI33661.1 MFS transporter [Streptomyces daghestanicus]